MQSFTNLQHCGTVSGRAFLALLSFGIKNVLIRFEFRIIQTNRVIYCEHFSPIGQTKWLHTIPVTSTPAVNSKSELLLICCLIALISESISQ